MALALWPAPPITHLLRGRPRLLRGPAFSPRPRLGAVGDRDQRQPYPKNGAALGGLGRDRTMVCLDDRTDDSQTKPVARAVGSRFVRANEPLEQPGQKFLVDARAVVGDGQFGIWC